MEYQSFENIVYLHACNKPILFKSIEDDYFQNPYVSRLFSLTKDFWVNYDSIPFDVTDPTLEQITELATRNIDKLQINRDLSPGENLTNFLNNAKNILESNYRKYDAQWLIKNIDKGWIPWEASAKGYRKAIELRKSFGNISVEQVPEVIGKCLDIVNKYSSIVVDEEDAVDFLDPEAHAPIPAENLINSGYGKMNLWLSGKETGGFKPGTLTIFVGEANIGKSIWLANVALGMYQEGYNILVISLEMAINEIFKRMGSKAFNIGINEYDDVSCDKDRLKEIMNKYVKEKTMDDMFEVDNDGNFKKLGKLYAKKMSDASPKKIRAFKQEQEKRLGIKFHAVVLDYMTELDNDHGINPTDMYMYHKTNCGDLYTMADKENLAVITAHQVTGSDFGADTLTLSSLAESRGIVHRPDNIWGIIQPPNLKLNNKYILKNMKTRTGQYKNYKIEYDISYEFMALNETGRHLEPNEDIS